PQAPLPRGPDTDGDSRPRRGLADAGIATAAPLARSAAGARPGSNTWIDLPTCGSVQAVPKRRAVPGGSSMTESTKVLLYMCNGPENVTLVREALTGLSEYAHFAGGE